MWQGRLVPPNPNLQSCPPSLGWRQGAEVMALGSTVEVVCLFGTSSEVTFVYSVY